MAIKIWNLMSGIDWGALPIMIEMFDIQDVELLIEQLTTIRDTK